MEKKHTEPNIKTKWVIAGLSSGIITLNKNGISMDACNWEDEEGILLTGNEAKVLIDNHYQLLEVLKEAYKELEFHNWHNSTTGLKVLEAIKQAEADINFKG